MKANKALKRITKIEELTSEVTRRLAKAAPHVGDVLKDLKVAVTRVKEAVSAHVSSLAAKKKTAPARKKAAAKNTAAKGPKVNTAKKAARGRRAVKKASAKRTVPAPAQLPETGDRELTPS